MEAQGNDEVEVLSFQITTHSVHSQSWQTKTSVLTQRFSVTEQYDTTYKVMIQEKGSLLI